MIEKTVSVIHPVRTSVCLGTLLLISLGWAAPRTCSARSPLPPQENAAIGRMMVPEAKLDCLTRVSPTHPQGSSVEQKAATVVLRAVITKTGTVLPQHKISGPSALEMEAMNAVRLWRYRPYVLPDGSATDVTTDLRVEFVPGMPGGLVSHPGH